MKTRKRAASTCSAFLDFTVELCVLEWHQRAQNRDDNAFIKRFVAREIMTEKRMACRNGLAVTTIFCSCLLLGCSSSQRTSVNHVSKSSSPPPKSALSSVDVNHPVAILRQEGRRTGSGIFSPDGKFFAAQCITARSGQPWSSSLVVWNCTTWKPERELKSVFLPINFSDDGQRLVTFNKNQDIQVWDTKSWTVILSRPAGGDAKISPQGTKLAIISESILHLWDVEPGKLLHTYNYAETIVGFSPDGKNLAITSPSYSRVIELSTGSEIHWFGPNEYILGYSTDGRMLATQNCVKGCTISLWDTKEWKVRRQLTGLRRDVRSISFSRDSKLMAVFEYEGGVHLWNLVTGKKLQHIDSKVRIGFVALSPDGQYLAAPFSDSQDKAVVKVLRISSGQKKS